MNVATVEFQNIWNCVWNIEMEKIYQVVKTNNLLQINKTQFQIRGV